MNSGSCGAAKRCGAEEVRRAGTSGRARHRHVGAPAPLMTPRQRQAMVQGRAYNVTARGTSGGWVAQAGRQAGRQAWHAGHPPESLRAVPRRLPAPRPACPAWTPAGTRRSCRWAALPAAVCWGWRGRVAAGAAPRRRCQPAPAQRRGRGWEPSAAGLPVHAARPASGHVASASAFGRAPATCGRGRPAGTRGPGGGRRRLARPQLLPPARQPARQPACSRRTCAARHASRL